MTTIKKVQSLVGKSVMYRSEKHQVIDVIERDDAIVEVITDVEDYKFSLAQLAKFVENSKEVSGEVSSYKDSQMTTQEKPVNKAIATLSELASQMGKVLSEDIEAIGKDASYIPQAKARKDNVETMIELMKVGIQMTKA